MENVASQENLSELLSRQLDEIGFSPKRIQERTSLIKKLSEAKDISTKKLLNRDDIEKIFVGSQREGTGLNHCNDLDVLQINHGVFCLINGHPLNTENGKVIFQAVQKNIPYGYVLLKLQSEGKSETFQQHKYALVEKNEEKYLSSRIFMTRNKDICQTRAGWLAENTNYQPQEGPSIPKNTVQNPIESFILSCLNLKTKKTDVVCALPCGANPILEEWSKRKRKSGWPCRKTITHVLGLPAYVVPVGLRGSKDEDLQWRVCFTKAEIYLIEDFNIVQTKVFIILKLIAKYVLQPISDDISSYVVKNVMLWMSEKIPQRKFCQDNLVARLGDAIKYLKKAVKENHLPNYMIPERNLFEGKLKGNEKALLMDKLNSLLENGEIELKKYMDKPDQLSEELEQVLSTYRIAKEIETDQMKILASFTKKQLVEKYIQMFSYESHGSTCHNILFTDSAVPFSKFYSREWFSESVNVQSSNYRKLLEQSLVRGFRNCKFDTANSPKTAIYSLTCTNGHLRSVVTSVQRPFYDAPDGFSSILSLYSAATCRPRPAATEIASRPPYLTPFSGHFSSKTNYF
ncbi:uncharacterized protein LOC123553944 [Mercenaria mercenaria]|uniref:uncharacterized protein LOC123553944 n=1 Tax=Mercenaria mercenaria TaxID=6596 RepID=UPI00234FA51B|nr:uncharacterized protein LOC123553944 [Mercenaria mercenaria]XP_053404624.1 uncharacterized protein LOC123553944 [Mercenaria mercenaria]